MSLYKYLTCNSALVFLAKFGCTVNPNPCKNGGIPMIKNGACACRCPEGLNPADNCATELTVSCEFYVNILLAFVKPNDVFLLCVKQEKDC